ncbi:MAG: TldD/PmbA family protein [Elusimicrobia bacterium]|nr:TldD/PmbA family protein [Elusimicrobiota bacterium]
MRAFIVLLFLIAPARASDEAAFSQMQAEMKRSMTSLRQKPFGPPYFLAYRLVDERRLEVNGYFGDLLNEYDDSARTLFVELRYGDRHFDNTELAFQGWHSAAPLENRALRQSLWSLTDAAYKSAVAGYLEKKARRMVDFVQQPLDDFSIEPATAHARAQPPARFDHDRARSLVQRVSKVFLEFPEIQDSRASLRLRGSRRLLLTSEGTRIATPEEHVPGSLALTAVTRSDDGMRLEQQESWSIRDLEDLPAVEALEAKARDMARTLAVLRHAPIQAPMAAPAILDPEFTGVLFHEALGHKLEGQRQREPRQSQVFRDLIGKRIIPEFLSLWDDPTLAQFRGVPLHGHYEFDSEGVAARPVVLVDKGILINFLMSRWPLKGFPRSNGHGRSDALLRPTGRMANLVVQAEDPISRPELENRLLDLIRRAGKAYGFWLVGAQGGDNPNTREAPQTLEVRPRLVYRVDGSTGRKTLVRGASMVGTPLVVLNRIVAAADDSALSNYFSCGAESGFVPVAQIAPSVLVSEVELQRLPEDRARPPLLPSPMQESTR